jgi:hypothetical protein
MRSLSERQSQSAGECETTTLEADLSFLVRKRRRRAAFEVKAVRVPGRCTHRADNGVVAELTFEDDARGYFQTGVSEARN